MKLLVRRAFQHCFSRMFLAVGLTDLEIYCWMVTLVLKLQCRTLVILLADYVIVSTAMHPKRILVSFWLIFGI
ncbi:hypothetical protein RchiOBHm_Chr2g0151451 [Rosa chinensis]|uniref:Uncharacterized protein n=1 Tax=Rosa chinensis TaxID=74649 RepID=A0A2P6S067_ROSCH|nr:hypothetical protein RchiOBHm_Chr2g0151451 [Rosa chinensis]